MKKKILMLAVLVILGTTSLFAFGIGVQTGASLGQSVVGNIAITFKLDTSPWVFAADGYIANNSFAFGMTADMWIGSGKISKTTIGYFYGWGVAGNIGASNNYMNFGIYARVLGGANIMLLKNFIEIYVQAAWQPGIKISSHGVAVSLPNFPVAAGIRFWIK